MISSDEQKMAWDWRPAVRSAVMIVVLCLAVTFLRGWKHAVGNPLTVPARVLAVALRLLLVSPGFASLYLTMWCLIFLAVIFGGDVLSAITYWILRLVFRVRDERKLLWLSLIGEAALFFAGLVWLSCIVGKL